MSESSPDLEDMDDNDDYNAEQYFDGGADNDLEVETLDNIFAAPPQNPQYGLKRRAGNVDLSLDNHLDLKTTSPFDK